MTLADVAWPVDAGKRLRSMSMLRAVSRLCDVDTLILHADADPQVRPLPPDVQGQWRFFPAQPQSALRSLKDVVRHQVPWQIAVQDWSPPRQDLAGRGPYDLAWFGGLDHFDRLRDVVRATRTIVDCDDVETEKLRRFLDLPASAALPWADRLQRRVELPMWGRIQRRAVAQADAVLVCSELDRVRLSAQAAGGDPIRAARVVNVPNTYAEPLAPARRHPEGPCTLVVIANYGTDQNLDAATFAAQTLLGPLRQAIPGARLRLVGRRIDRLESLRGIDGVDLVGPVDSVAQELARAHAVLVPIRFGGGTRLKVVEAMAYGVPVISTTAGAEGIDAQDGTHLLLADTPDHVVAAVERIVHSPALAAQLSGAGRELYLRKYRPQATDDAVGAVLRRLLELPG
jgi:glycosyltransferase involved in cell wall biosynthesis